MARSADLLAEDVLSLSLSCVTCVACWKPHFQVPWRLLPSVLLHRIPSDARRRLAAKRGERQHTENTAQCVTFVCRLGCTCGVRESAAAHAACASLCSFFFSLFLLCSSCFSRVFLFCAVVGTALEAWSVGEAATTTIDVVTPQSAPRDAWMLQRACECVRRREDGAMMRNRGICMKGHELVIRAQLPLMHGTEHCRPPRVMCVRDGGTVCVCASGQEVMRNDEQAYV